MMFQVNKSSIGLLCISLLSSAQTTSKEAVPVRAQLISIQKETGLTLVSFGWGAIVTLDFSHRSFSVENLPGPAGKSQDGMTSPDGTEIAFTWEFPAALDSRLGVVHRDGSNLREFPEIRDSGNICWSPDQSMVAVVVGVSKPLPKRLSLVDLRSKKIQDIEGPVSITTQCWSPDGKMLAYGIIDSLDEHGPRGRVAVYDISEKKSYELGNGSYPAWSPTGDWISFLEGDAYHAVRPSGKGRRLLFRVKHATTGLIWSPDSRFVAYATRTSRWLDPSLLVRIHVRRLADGSDDWVAVQNMIRDRFQWMKSVKTKQGTND